jgi:hypothetical protein
MVSKFVLDLFSICSLKLFYCQIIKLVTRVLQPPEIIGTLFLTLFVFPYSNISFSEKKVQN